MSKEKDFSSLLSKKKHAPNSNPATDKTLADSISQFDKADQIMSNLNHNQAIPEIKSDKRINKSKAVMVTYSLPEEYLDMIQAIRNRCMREEIEINKSDIIKIGIELVSKLTETEIFEMLEGVKINRGRPKLQID